MRILFDVDGVLRDMIGKLNAVYDREFPGRSRLDYPREWGLSRAYDIGDDIYEFAFKTHAGEIFGEAEPFPEYIELCNALFKQHHITIATSQNPHSLIPTMQWLMDNQVKFHDIYVTGCDGKYTDKSIPGDILIDDGIHNLTAFEKIPICVARPWNKEYTGVRFKSANRVLKHICNIAKLPEKGNGVKYDQGKDRWDLLPWDQLEQIVKVMTFGANKYEDWNWVKVDDPINRYFAAFMRHKRQHEAGEYLDQESNLPHWAHMGCCVLFLTYFFNTNVKKAKQN